MAKQTWFWLAAGLGYGAVNVGELLEAYPGGAEEIASDLGGQRLDELITQKQAERLASSRPADFALRIAHFESQGIICLPFDDPDYPDILRRINNPPPILFVKGDVTLLNGQLSIGMVGARRPTAYGVEAVKAIGRGIALGGAIIVSGLAAGLDAEAHKAALAVNGPTIACIAFGHDHCYPAANRKLMELIERHGAVISEYPLGTGPEKPFFLQRNRLIAGMCHGLVVVEARQQSGTMSTVNFATDYGRDVFAVPGSIFSELSGGTNAMIKEGAYVAGSASDVLAAYGVSLASDPLEEMVAQQAREGRPAATEAAPPWQQSVKRYQERVREEHEEQLAEQLPGQQTLGEVLRAQVWDKGSSGPVTTAQAVDAFRSIQQSLPPGSDSELDARNRALDEMVLAVNDSVEISDDAVRPARGDSVPATQTTPAGQTVQPFPWNTVERLEKSQVEDLSAAKPVTKAASRGEKPSLASRLFNIGQQSLQEGTPEVPAPVPVIHAAPQEPPVTQDVTRQRPAPISADAPHVPRHRVLNTGQPSEEAQQAFVTPGQARQAEKRGVPGQLQHQPLPVQDAAPEEAVVDSRGLLSDTAKRALGALGVVPLTLAMLCERSGLSSAEAMAALTELELAGLSRQLPGRQFVRADGV